MGKEKQKISDTLCAVILLGFIALFALALTLFSQIKQPEEQHRKTVVNQTDADSACRYFIKNRLHDPGGAQFPSGTFEAWRDIKGEEDSWIVQRQFRARNGFNALRSATWTCHVTYRNEEWFLDSI